MIFFPFKNVHFQTLSLLYLCGKITEDFINSHESRVSGPIVKTPNFGKFNFRSHLIRVTLSKNLHTKLNNLVHKRRFLISQEVNQ